MVLNRDNAQAKAPHKRRAGSPPEPGEIWTRDVVSRTDTVKEDSPKNNYD